MISDYFEATGTASIAAGSRTAADVVMGFPVGIVGHKIYQEPMWNTLYRRVETLVYLELSQIVRNISVTPLEPGDVVAFALPEGRVEVAGKTLCSIGDRSSPTKPAYGPAKPASGPAGAAGESFFLVGFLRPFSNRFLETNDIYHFRVVGDLVYPPSGERMFSKTPVPLAKLSESVDE